MTMLTTNLLFAVPEAVARQILVEWLGLKGVARTDSAVCSWKTRAAFLSLAYDKSVVYDRRRGGSIFSFEFCAPWCIIRGARVSAISLTKDSPAQNHLLDHFLTLQGPLLTELNMEVDNRTADRRCDLLKFASWSTGLRKVSLRLRTEHPNDHSWDDHLTAFTLSCQQLRTLALDGVVVTKTGLRRALEQCHHLESLVIHLPYSFSGGGQFPSEVAIPSLTYLALSAGDANDDLLHLLAARCPKLMSLNVFNGHYRITDAGVRAVLQGCPLLWEMDVEYAENISEDMRVELIKLRKSKKIDLHQWAHMNQELMERLLEVSPQLTILRIIGYWLGDATLVACAQHCPLLAYVDVDCWMNSITTAGLVQLFKPGSVLRKVAFHGMQKTIAVGEVAGAIAQNCAHVEDLSFGGPAINDDAVFAVVRGCPGLRRLSLQGEGVTDAAVTQLAAQCSSLERLHLGSCLKVTVLGARALIEGCLKLTYLFLPGSINVRELPPLHLPEAKVYTG
jgi:hypothetical protein